MMDIITSFLLLIDIINLQKTSKLFNNICKINTNEIIEAFDYCQYIKYYNRQQETKFKLKDIKKLDLIMHGNEQLKFFTPTIKYNTNLIFFNLCVPIGFTNNFTIIDENSIIPFVLNIPNNITINKLQMSGICHNNLISKCKQFCLSRMSLTVEIFDSLCQSQIEILELVSCSFDDDINKINVKNWKSLKQLNIFFGQKNVSKFIYDSILLNAPNLKKLKILAMLPTDVIVPLKISNRIKTLIWKHFDDYRDTSHVLESNLIFFNNMKKENHQFHSVHLSFQQNWDKIMYPKQLFNCIFDDILEISKCVCIFGDGKGIQQVIENHLESLQMNKIIVRKNGNVTAMVLSKVSKNKIKIVYGECSNNH